MDRIQRIFFLRELYGFNSMRDHEIEVIAEVLSERTYTKDSLVANSGAALTSLLITVSGALMVNGEQRLPKIVGAPSLLFGWELKSDIVSTSDTDTVCLTLRKGLFFTLVHECPSFMFSMLGKTENRDLYSKHEVKT